MDRQIAYYGALARANDPLLIGQNAMVGQAKLNEAVVGSAGAVDGFALAPTAPASLAIIIGAGSVYQQAQLEASAISLLAVDTHSIVKQGIQLDPVNLTMTPPTTTGYAQNVLIQVQYTDADAGSTVLSYYNATNPSVPYSGPANNGQAQATVRKGAVSIQAKYGVAASAGTQTNPTPDPGWIVVGVVTLSQGQTAITAGNITAYAGSAYFPKLTQLGTALRYYANCSGTGSALSLTAPTGSAYPFALFDGTTVTFVPSNTNPGATTISAYGLGTISVYDPAGVALQGGEFQAGVATQVIYSTSLPGWRIAPWAIGAAQRSTFSASGPAAALPTSTYNVLLGYNSVVNPLKRGTTYNNSTGVITLGAGDGGQWISTLTCELQDNNATLLLLTIEKNGGTIAWAQDVGSTGYKRTTAAHIGGYVAGDQIRFKLYYNSSTTSQVVPYVVAGAGKLG